MDGKRLIYPKYTLGLRPAIAKTQPPQRIDLLNALCFFRLRKWDLKIENTSLAQFTFHPNFPAVAFRNGFDDGESEPGAALRERFAVGTPIEFLEQARQICLLDTDTAILHGKGQGNRGCLQANRDLATFRRLLEGILYQVIKCLLQ